MESARAHWDRVYREKDPDAVSWYERVPATSLEMIGNLGLDPRAPILEVGGGASALAARLLAAGHSDVTVADISEAALARARGALAEPGRVHWVLADVREDRFARRYALWHDRAVLHFMVTEQDRAAYLRTLRATLERGGHAIIATFGPRGPTRCSGLPTARYDAAALAGVLGEGFALAESRLVEHHTPSGTSQQFLYACFRRR
ncbi:MAG: methyltransferase domain-containing protein [Solirubrobacterales bacterium]